MKITRNHPDQLIIDYVPWVLTLLVGSFAMVFIAIGVNLLMQGDLLGLLFALIGGGTGFAILAAFAVRVQIILDRPANTLTLRRRTLRGYSQIRHDLSDLKNARLESTRGSKGQTLYRPSLVLTGMSVGTHPILQSYTNTKGPERAVTAINTWLGQTPSPVDMPRPSD